MLNLHCQWTEDVMLKGEVLNITKKKDRKLSKQNKKSPVLLLHIHNQRNRTGGEKDSQ